MANKIKPNPKNIAIYIYCKKLHQKREFIFIFKVLFNLVINLYTYPYILSSYPHFLYILKTQNQ
jgi:hypothetical protein